MSGFEHFVGTRPVSGSHAFDVLALQNWLSVHLPGFAGPLTVEMFKGGQSNPTYKLVTPSVSYVMRTKPGPAAKLLASAHAVERETDHRAGQAMLGGIQPTICMLGMCRDQCGCGGADNGSDPA